MSSSVQLSARYYRLPFSSRYANLPCLRDIVYMDGSLQTVIGVNGRTGLQLAAVQSYTTCARH